MKVLTAMGSWRSRRLGRFPFVAFVLLQAGMFCLPNAWLQAGDKHLPWLALGVVQVLNLGVVVALPFLFRTPRSSRWVMIPLAALALYATHFLHAFGGMPGAGAYLSLARTNLRESLEYVQTIWSSLLLIAGLSVAYGFAFQAATAPFDRERLAKIRKPVLAGCLTCIAVCANWDTFPIGMVLSRPAGLTFPLKNSFPVGFVLSAQHAYAFAHALGGNNRDFKFHAQRTAPVAGREVYVLVIGESASASFWSLGGYPDETNARLRPYRDSGALTYFPATVAQGNYTAIAVPMIITAATPYQFDRSAREKSLVAAFKEAGFTTYWFSNQDPASHMDEADFPINLHLGAGITTTNFDEDLLPFLDAVLASPLEKAFIVIHLMGSHTAYEARVPPGFKTPPLRGTPMTAAYARTICYTDYVLDGIIQRLGRVRGRSFLWYVSDHGQTLRPGEVGHGSVQASVEELHVPMLFWGNEAFRGASALDLDRLRQHRLEVLSQGVTFPTVLHLGGVTYPGLDATRDLCSGAFLAGQTPKVLNGEVTSIHFMEGTLHSGKTIGPSGAWTVVDPPGASTMGRPAE